MHKELLNIREAADFLGLSPGTLYNMVSRRRIPFIKVGARTMFKKADLDRWLEKHTVQPIDASR